MDERGQMHHFNNGGDGHVRIVQTARGLATEANEHGTQLLALDAEGVFGVAFNIRLKFSGLRAETFPDFEEKGLRARDYFFPTQGIIGRC